MYKKNSRHLQIPLTSHVDELPDNLRKHLENSWGGVFYREFFVRLDEAPFAKLYADIPSRPNVPVNVLVGLEYLKAGNGWTDEEMYDNYCYDIQVRYALGYRQLGEGYFDLRSLYYFRERLSRHMQETGESLLEQAFEQVTDKQLAAFQVKSSKQRMDSVQVASNIRQMGRVQLLVEVLQRVQRMLSEADQQRYQEDFAPYMKGHAGHYVYRMKGDEVGPHLQRIGEFMQRLLGDLKSQYGQEAIYLVLERVFGEHFRIEQAQMTVKANQELSAASLQSPDDLEATYREKRGVGYQGYVANVTETCDPENELQLITKVQVASNNTDDSQLLAEALPNLKERTQIKELYTDGGYGGSQADPVLATQQVELTQTAIRGRTPDPDKPHLADFDIRFAQSGKPSQVACPQGQTVSAHPTCQQKGFVAHFELPICQECPLFKEGKCLAKAGKRDARLHLRFTQAEAQAAQRRRRSRESGRAAGNLRSAVEATVRSLKHPFPEAQLPVRGKFRVACMLIGSAAVANIRRIQRYLEAKSKAETPVEEATAAKTERNSAPETSVDSFFGAVGAFLTRLFSPVLTFSSHCGC